MSWFNLRTKEALLQSVNLFKLSPRTSLAGASDGFSAAMFRRSGPVHKDRCRKKHLAVSSAQKKCFLTQRSQANNSQNNEKKIFLSQAPAKQEQSRWSKGSSFSTFVKSEKALLRWSQTGPQHGRLKFTTKQQVETPAKWRTLPLPN
jgi:hypothetical protein